MAKLKWDQVGERLYEAGADHAILFVMGKDGKYQPGVAWNGITKVTIKPEGAEEEGKYADNIKYLALQSAEEVKGTIEAFTYPKEFGACDGSAEVAKGIYVGQQTRRGFAIVYRNHIGNDTEYNDYSEKVNIIYGAKAAPSERSNETINEKTDAMTMSWDYTTSKVKFDDNYKPTAYVSFTKDGAGESYSKILDVLEGTDSKESELLMPDELIKMGVPLDTKPSDTDSPKND